MQWLNFIKEHLCILLDLSSSSKILSHSSVQKTTTIIIKNLSQYQNLYFHKMVNYGFQYFLNSPHKLTV